MSVNIELLRLDRQTEINLLADLQEVCQVVERRAFGLMYECETNNPAKITKILANYEKLGFEIINSSDGETTVFTVRPWTGFSRTQTQSGHVGQLTQRISILALPPSEEKAKKKGW